MKKVICVKYDTVAVLDIETKEDLVGKKYGNTDIRYGTASLTLLTLSFQEENVHVPAESASLMGRENLRALRDALSLLLGDEAPNA